jgi:hypothetical protein
MCINDTIYLKHFGKIHVIQKFLINWGAGRFSYVLSYHITVCLLFTWTCDGIKTRVANVLVILCRVVRVVSWIFKYQLFLNAQRKHCFNIESDKYSEFCVLKSGDLLFRCTNKKIYDVKTFAIVYVRKWVLRLGYLLQILTIRVINSNWVIHLYPNESQKR